MVFSFACTGWRRALPWVLGVLMHISAQAQSWVGISASNYNGTNGLALNPANIADSRYRTYVNLLGGDFSFYNTYLTLDAPYSAWQLARDRVPGRYRNAEGEIVFKPEYLRESLNGRAKYASISAEVRLPTLFFSFGAQQQQSVAVGSRVRALVQGNGVSEEVARLSRYGLYKADDLGLAFKALQDNRFAINLNAYQEFAGTYARTLTPNARHFFKAGLTLKYLVGLGSGYINNQGLGYTVYEGDSIQVRSRSLTYGYTDYKYYDNDFKISNLYNKNRLGRGLGLDLGLVYEFRPDHEKYDYVMDDETRANETANKYRLRLGLGLTDLGRVKYDAPAYVSASQLAATTTLQLGSLDTLSFRNLRYVDALVQKLVGVEGRTTSFKSQLPRALNLSADYHLGRSWYLGLLWQQNLLGRYAVGARTFSQLALTPRFERRRFEASVPLILANDYRSLQVGAMLRFSTLFVGSDNLAGLFGGTTFRGYNLYFGVGIGLKRRAPKDHDNDHVSDRRDECPDLPGVWEFKGCPDRDGDHVADAFDNCPDDPGLVKFKGCPDRDEDEVIDKLDECPDTPGLVALKGCPDRDGDGIRDGDDRCPEQAGPAELQGCPDRDKDGVADLDDKCPDLPGPKDHFGCPDTDGDGVYDNTDQCPTQAGPPENGGCPWPDADGDTVPDKDDECPQTPGTVENRGCPVLEKAQQKVLNTAFANLEFEFRKAIIRKKSYPGLDALAKLLVENPAFRLRLAGHTDQVGTPAFNLKLSQQRADAVKTYLLKRGVLPADRILVEGYGATVPLDTNITAAGRARNRRVEMTVLFD